MLEQRTVSHLQNFVDFYFVATQNVTIFFFYLVHVTQHNGSYTLIYTCLLICGLYHFQIFFFLLCQKVNLKGQYQQVKNIALHEKYCYMYKYDT